MKIEVNIQKKHFVILLTSFVLITSILLAYAAYPATLKTATAAKTGAYHTADETIVNVNGVEKTVHEAINELTTKVNAIPGATSTYDSGWVRRSSETTGSAVNTLAHTLGVENLVVTVYGSENSQGTNSAILPCRTGSAFGACVTSLTSSSLKVVSGYNFYDSSNTAKVLNYIKVVARPASPGTIVGGVVSRGTNSQSVWGTASLTDGFTPSSMVCSENSHLQELWDTNNFVCISA